MIKRIITAAAALCMLYGSTLFPAADMGGVAVRQIKITGFDEANVIKPIPVKEEDNGSAGRSEGTVEEHQYGTEEGSDGDRAGGTEAGAADGCEGGGTGSEECQPGADEYQPDEAGDAEGYSGGAESTDEEYPEDIRASGEDSGEEVSAEENSVVEESSMEYLGNWCITAYCGCVECNGQWADGKTAYGEIPTAGHTVACNILPAYTQVLIGDTVYTVEDTGYTPYGDAWIDIYFDTHEEAEAWGVQYLDVYEVKG